MIHQISSNLESFKTLDFKPGLNILRANKTIESSDQQSRNGAGKSCMIDLINFVFGSSLRKGSIFLTKVLKKCEFTLTMDIFGEICGISRSGARPNIIIVDGDTSKWPIEPISKIGTGPREFEIEDWKRLLGNMWFDLPISKNNHSETGHPTFRSLFPYFARMQSNGGFFEPLEFFSKQSKLHAQISVGYLLGLNWKIPVRIDMLKSQEKSNRQLLKSAKSEEFSPYGGDMAVIRSVLVELEKKIDELHSQISKYRVVPQYKELEAEANELTYEINELNNENFFDASFLKDLNASIEEEEAPEYSALLKSYDEAGIAMPELVVNRLENVKKFHEAIIENRRIHLTDEIGSIESRVKKRDKKIAEKDQRRSEIMSILSKGGALEHFASLRDEVGRKEAEAAMLRNNLAMLEKCDSRKKELIIKRVELKKELSNDIQEREPYLSEAIVEFAELSKHLYEKSGIFIISESVDGYKFEFEIQSKHSKGISNMQIFCFDLMLMLLKHKYNRQNAPGFLVHDSHLFDGVDERQIARALEIGKNCAEEYEFQYLVTMNTDALPREGFSQDFEISDCFVDQELTDETESGGLFGIRF